MADMNVELIPATKTTPATLVIRIPVNSTAQLSSTGKTKIIASSHGNQATAVTVGGQVLKVGVNAFVKV